MNKNYWLSIDLSEEVSRQVELKPDDAKFLMTQDGFIAHDDGGRVLISRRSSEKKIGRRDPVECKHELFAGDLEVARVTKTEGGPVTGYDVYVKVNCAQCGQAFAFLGFPGGLLSGKPTMNVDGTEGRFPISPSNGEIRISKLTYEAMRDQPGRG